MMTRFCLILVLVLTVCSAVCAGQSFTYVDLVHRLTDLEGLAVLPVQGEICAQWSSYDRASRYDTAAGKYVGWDANGDGNGIIRTEGDTEVAAEIDGPGCIWRIWSANAQNGHVKIYLDGAAEPAVDLPFNGYFDRQNAPFVYPALVHRITSGYNNYVPIPFAKSCKVVMDKDWGQYYHFTYSKFPAGTTVPTFKRDLSPEETSALEKADRFLEKRLGADPAGKRAGEEIEWKRIDLAGDETITIAKLTGKRAITGMWVKLDSARLEKNPDILRNVALRMQWDGEKNPSVWAPLGDFFGSGPGINHYKSLPLGMTKDLFYSYWYMPFAKGAVVELVNGGKDALTGEFMIAHSPVTRPIETLGRFHAKWHRDAFLPTEKERGIDWPMLKTQGKGRFCGVMMSIWSPKGGWWGEGDEKFFVDGEKFPSTIGTGSEDYFGYAWGDPALFQNAYHNQTLCHDNVGDISLNRWHITDNVPFQKSFEGDIEKYYPNDRPCLYASVAYWYLAPGGVDPYGEVPAKNRLFSTAPKSLIVPNAIEGESMEILGKTGGKTERQGIEVLSRGAQLWWIEGKPGDKLDLALPVDKTGAYKIKMQFIKAPDYGIVQIYLDGQKLGEPIDLYNASGVPSGEVSLGKMKLTAGEHKLTVEIVGANKKAVKAYMFGLDYVRFLGF
jgi:hypothetical protein